MVFLDSLHTVSHSLFFFSRLSDFKIPLQILELCCKIIVVWLHIIPNNLIKMSHFLNSIWKLLLGRQILGQSQHTYSKSPQCISFGIPETIPSVLFITKWGHWLDSGWWNICHMQVSPLISPRRFSFFHHPQAESETQDECRGHWRKQKDINNCWPCLADSLGLRNKLILL